MKLSLLFIIFFSSQLWAKWSVTTYNIRNFDNDRAGPTNLVELKKIIKSIKSDVFAFEEVVNISAFQNLIKTTLPGYEIQLSRCGGNGRQNLAIVYNLKTFGFVKKFEDTAFGGGNTRGNCGSLRPLFLVTLENLEQNINYTFGAVHLKAGGSDSAFTARWAQYRKLAEVSKKYRSENLILLGDFNTTGYNIHDEDFEKFETYLSGSSLRTMTENIACTSYWEGSENTAEHQPSILDHIVIPDKMTSLVSQVKIGAHCAQQNCRAATPQDLGIGYLSVSDHCPLQVSFK